MFALYPPDEEKSPFAVCMRKNRKWESVEARLEASVEPKEEKEEEELLKDFAIEVVCDSCSMSIAV